MSAHRDNRLVPPIALEEVAPRVEHDASDWWKSSYPSAGGPHRWIRSRSVASEHYGLPRAVCFLPLPDRRRPLLVTAVGRFLPAARCLVFGAAVCGGSSP